MGRDEELQQAAGAYASQMCNDCSARLYCEERNKKCAEYREQVKVYADGAKWADEHPKNVWHPADEEPEGKKWKILLEDKSGNHWVARIFSASVFFGNWQKFTEHDALIRWAYISDLLPKQFGISEQLKGGEL